MIYVVLSKGKWNYKVDKAFLSAITPVDTKITGAEKRTLSVTRDYQSKLELVRLPTSP